MIENLVFLYHTMRASEDLLSVAAGRAAGALKEYYLKHLEEERGHHEWLAEDLAVAGVDAARSNIPIEACEIVGHVYYMIFHVDPCALLGYMLLMESAPVSSEHLEQLEFEHGRELLRTMRYHADHDPDHLKEIRAQIRTLVQSQEILVKQTFDVCRNYFLKAARGFGVSA